MKIENAAALFFLILVGMNSSANADSLTPETIKSELTNGTQLQIANLANSLTLLVPAGARHGAMHDKACTTYESVKVDYVPFFGSGKQAVIQADSTECQYSYLVVLEKTSDGAWTHIRTIHFRNGQGDTSISFENISSAEHSDVIVRNSEIDYGAGIEHRDLTILRIDQNAVQIVFDEPLELELSIPVTINGKQDNTSQSEKDEYTFLNAPAHNGVDSNQKIIIRKQMIRDHDTQITRWWHYIWDPQFTRYIGYQSGPPAVVPSAVSTK